VDLDRREALRRLGGAGLALSVRAAAVPFAPCGVLVPEQVAPNTPYTPTSHYDILVVEGWRVRVNRDFRQKRAALCREVLKLLSCKLYAVSRIVPPTALKHIKQVPIWLELREGHHPCMVYHPDAGWLREHDMNPEKAHCVEIAGAENFLSWEHDQPWMCLHELAHSYHDQVLGFENAEVRNAYDQAVRTRIYESVLRISGTHERHYALTDQKEYFAECSESYFGVNDFFPFVRAELREHDRLGYQVVEKMWRL